MPSDGQIALDAGHVYVYLDDVKRRDLERRLASLGWTFLRHGGSHDVWSRGTRTIAVPRHSEVNEHTARDILRDAEKE
jgi:mRNA interferase HicA